MIKVESFGIVPFRHEEGAWKVLLILHVEGNHWGFPKGKANPGETALESAMRELKEETGFAITEILLQEPLIEQYQFRRRRDLVIKTVQYFAALVNGPMQLQVEEISDAKWMTIPEALEKLTFRGAGQILEKFVSLLNIPTA